MMARTSSQANLGCLILNVSLGQDGADYQRKIENYLAKNGPEWTCNRVKSVRQVALLLKSGESEKAREVLQKNSIAYHKGTMIPKGIEGVVVRRYVEAQRTSVIKRIDAAMRFYTSLVLEEISPKQSAKALHAITDPSTSELSYEQQRMEGQSDFRASCQGRGVSVVPLSDRPIGPGERHCEHLKATSKYYSRNKVPKGMKGVPYSSMAMSFMTEPWLPESIDDMVPCTEMRAHIMQGQWFAENPQEFVGKITPIQEQGCKARVVFQPSAWIQLGFMPLNRRLFDISEKMFPKESCVFDQVRGAYALYDHLQRGKTAYCTDLSSATDRFPRAFSLGVLEAMGYSRYAEALEAVCQKPAKCDFAPSGQVKYSVGQPMGIYGSFPLFHLSNMLVADAAVRQAQRLSKLGKSTTDGLTAFGDNTFFKTVGDDIIFSDHLVASCYRHHMLRYGVEISESKSFEGNLAEFAGFIAVKTTRGQAVYRPYKVPNGDLITNPIQFLDSLGAALPKRMPKRTRPYWDRQFRWYRQTVGSRDLALDPIVPGESVSFKDANRGDNRVLVNLCNAISAQSTDTLPDLSGSTQINKVPLFRERGPFDFYGYNPDNLVRDERQFKTESMRYQPIGIRNDPLMREVRELSPLHRLIRQRASARTVESTNEYSSSEPDDLVSQASLRVEDGSVQDKLMTTTSCTSESIVVPRDGKSGTNDPIPDGDYQDGDHWADEIADGFTRQIESIPGEPSIGVIR